ncbi:MAG: Rho termination factor N-terminal domain-containing protein [Blautia sp.]|nr:Rho termination factor N-terminal domain-containing protein [Blautia sp.]
MILIKDNVERVASGHALIQKLKSEGYRELDGQPVDIEEEVSRADIQSMTVAQLRALAKERGISGANALKRDELLELLTEGGEEDGAAG